MDIPFLLISKNLSLELNISRRPYEGNAALRGAAAHITLENSDLFPLAKLLGTRYRPSPVAVTKQKFVHELREQKRGPYYIKPTLNFRGIIQ